MPILSNGTIRVSDPSQPYVTTTPDGERDEEKVIAKAKAKICAGSIPGLILGSGE